jgi:hypothetical protein
MLTADEYFECTGSTRPPRGSHLTTNEFGKYTTTKEGLKQQLVLQVIADNTYTTILEDNDFGYADVTPIQIPNFYHISFYLFSIPIQ